MTRNAWRLTTVLTAVLVLASACRAAAAEDANLTGKWSINYEGGTYYIRQVGDEVWWVGESKNQGKDWTNIGHGRIEGKELTVKWADSPKGMNDQSGILILELVVRDGKVVELKKKKQEGGEFGGDTFKRK